MKESFYDEELFKARTVLSRARADAREANRIQFANMTAAAQRQVDSAALAAYQKGATKTSIAALLGESRTTVNDRLSRAAGDVVVAESAPAVVQTQPDEPTYRIDGDQLHVNWRNYGPDHITDFGVVEIVYDTDDDGYWFTAIDGDENQVVQRLDTIWTGWYYADAASFVKGELTNEEKNEAQE